MNTEATAAPCPADTHTLREPTPSRGHRRSILRRIADAYNTDNTVLIFLLSVVAGLVISSIVIVVSSDALRHAWISNPIRGLAQSIDYLNKAYTGLFKGAVGDPAMFQRALDHPNQHTWTRALTPIGNSLTDAVPLIIASCGIAVAFRSGVWNMGGHYQLICGAIGSSWVGFSFAGLPWLVHVTLALAAGAIFGALGGLIPGVLRAYTGAHEVIVTIMLNYVAALLIIYLVSETFFKSGGADVDTPTGRVTVASAALTPMIHGFPVNAGIVVAVLVVVFATVLLDRSRVGFMLQISGESPNAARIAGISPTTIYIVAFAISGAIVGIAGGVQVLGVSHQLQVGFGADMGYLCILIAYLGRNNPLWVCVAAVFYGALQAGGLTMQFDSGISYQLTNIIQALIVLFVTAPALIAEIYRLHDKRRATPAAGTR
ncbi:MAG: ABC transporter permease [Gordonia sp. (in: high G+C Gram-positive bacteria)]